MIWLDMVIEGKINHEKFAEDIAIIFSTQRHCISLVSDLSEIKDNCITILIGDELNGIFKTFLTFYLDHQISAEDTTSKVSQIANTINKAIIISDDSDNNPYSGLLFRPKQQFVKILLSSDLLDNENIYHVVKIFDD